jgi:hypothetical protein
MGSNLRIPPRPGAILDIPNRRTAKWVRFFAGIDVTKLGSGSRFFEHVSTHFAMHVKLRKRRGFRAV